MRGIENTFVLGSCFDVLPKIQDNYFDLIITDPPQYRLINKNIEFDDRADIVRNVSFDQFDDYSAFMKFTKYWLKLCDKKSKDNSTMIVFFAENYVNDLIYIGKENNFEHKDTLYWHKVNPAPKVRKTGFISSVETFVYFTKGKPTFNFLNQNDMHDFIETTICMGNERLKDKNNETLHPTQKPLRIFLKYIKIASNLGDNVLDPFSGVATTNVACKLLNRSCLGIEINNKYHQAGLKRLNDIKINYDKGSVNYWLRKL